ncbi:hypothetical protein V6N13_030062 [Hibiscus sabdariffa]|uniref:C2H2-type domain-containing protein n=2 Tax=Hibiscus sabdariffa TaxID=183260 RepID=A0ABR2AIC8_9ROSI
MMMMREAQEEVVLCKHQLPNISKGKRPRAASPLTLGMASCPTSSSGGDSREFDGSTTTSVELESTAQEEEEEEDMAYCLMLLSQRETRKPSHRCKTCNRCFPSFQALGGHTASHKKPKLHHHQGLFKSGNMNKTFVLCNKSRVHQCSICGADFSSGQALGGHMRRHRTSTNAPTTTLAAGPQTEQDLSSNKPTTVLQLDLNLPAPEDDHHKEPNLQFASREKLAFFSASSLVHCHY